MVRCSAHVTVYASSKALAWPILCLAVIVVFLSSEQSIRTLRVVPVEFGATEGKYSLSDTEKGSVAQSRTDGFVSQRAQFHELNLDRPNTLTDLLSIDILSIGSQTRPAYHDAQQDTFGSSSSVRNFIRVTEEVDSDQTCSTSLSWSSLVGIVMYCRGRYPSWPPTINQPRNTSFTLEQRKRFVPVHKLLRKANPIGWLCAQKRPLEAFVNYMQQFHQDHYSNPESNPSATKRQYGVSDLPDYLFIIDDDTYVNLPLVETELRARFPSHSAYAVSGRLLGSHKYYPYPVGGLGIIFSKPVLQNFLTPIYCNEPVAAGAEFVALVCQQITNNLIGELSIFRNGMTVLDLLHAYVTRNRYTDFPRWSYPGYCMHSDWVWGFIFRAYHLTGPNDQMRPYNASSPLEGEGHSKSPYDDTMHDNTKSECTVHSHLCHYAGPEQMKAIYKQSL
jgi:hypothetical protein